MKLLRIIIFFPLALTRLLLVLFISFYVLVVGILKKKKQGYSRNLQIWVMHTWGAAVAWILGIKANVHGQPESDNFILMPNHRSYLDIPLVVKYNQGTLVGKAEVGKWPMARTAAKLTNPILVKRSEMRSLVETMKKIKESVDNNIPVILFPEGTTHTGPLTKPFKNGSFKIAADARIPVIPVAIHYADPGTAWVGNDTFFGHFFRQMGKPATKVIMRYGDPVANPDYKTLKEQVRGQIDNMLKKMIKEFP